MRQTIFRKAKKATWVTVDKGFVEKETLSLKAKGLLLYLLSLPDDWKIYSDELVNHHKDGKYSVASAIKELKDNNYLVYTRFTDQGGKFTEGAYFVHELPQT